MNAIVDPSRHGVLWLLVAFVLTTLVTRWMTRRIRARELRAKTLASVECALGEGADLIKNMMIAGIHIHHQVWGVLLTLVVGLLLVTYHPTGTGAHVLAGLFGVGAALALDEFAMWLHLEDVYWSTRGRSSITALMVAVAITLALVLGANPLDIGSSSGGDPLTGLALLVGVLINLAFVTVCILKGKLAIGLVGLFVPVVALVAAVRVAMPDSWWARRRYAVDGRKDRRSRGRFDAAYHARWDRLRDLIGGPPDPD